MLKQDHYPTCFNCFSALQQILQMSVNHLHQIRCVGAEEHEKYAASLSSRTRTGHHHYRLSEHFSIHAKPFLRRWFLNWNQSLDAGSFVSHQENNCLYSRAPILHNPFRPYSLLEMHSKPYTKHERSSSADQTPTCGGVTSTAFYKWWSYQNVYLTGTY